MVPHDPDAFDSPLDRHRGICRIRARSRPGLNRLLLRTPVKRFPMEFWRISDAGASNLASLGFICFLIGRVSGAGLLRSSRPTKSWALRLAQHGRLLPGFPEARLDVGLASS